MSEHITPGYYRHFKGAVYFVEGTGLDSETQAPRVIYRGWRDGSQIWLRPPEMWTEPVERELEDGTLYVGPRFRYLGPKMDRDFFGPREQDEFVAAFEIAAVQVEGDLWEARSEHARGAVARHADRDEARRRLAWSCLATSQSWPQTEELPPYVELARDHLAKVERGVDGTYRARWAQRTCEGSTRWAALFKLGGAIAHLDLDSAAEAD